MYPTMFIYKEFSDQNTQLIHIMYIKINLIIVDIILKSIEKVLY